MSPTTNNNTTSASSPKTFGFRNYISKQGQRHIQSFQYNSAAPSLFYQHFWSPVCEWFIDNVIPQTMAPNLITLLGFLPLVVSHILFLYYSPNMDEQLPRWVIALSGVSLVYYQLMDNIDGKQARKTMNSSPLGMLFDHGLDTITSWVVGLLVMCCLRMGSSPLTLYGIFVIPQIPFYLAMWMQLNVNTFKLGYINAIDEGLVFIEVFLLATSVTGQGVYMQTIPILNMQVNEFIVIANFFVVGLQMLYFILEAARELKLEVWKRALQLWPVPTLLASLWYIAEGSGSDIVQKNIYLVYVTLSILFSTLITELQLAHISKTPFNAISSSFIIPVTILFGVFFMNSQGGSNHYDEVTLFKIVLAGGLLNYFHMVYSVCMQISTILDIKIFQINKQILPITPSAN